MKKIRLTFGLVFIAPVFIVLGYLAVILGNLLRLLHLERASEKTVHFILDILIAWIFLWLGIRLRVEGKENIPAWGTKVCYFSNHQSLMDIPIIFGAGMWCGIVAKKELYRIPLLRGLLNVLKCVAIDRSSLRNSMQAILKGSDQIKEGYPMGIFPEGTRSRTGEMLEMKAGAFKMATRAGALVVPVAMKNTRKTFEGADSLRPVHVYVRIMEPIDSSALSEEETRDLHTIVENRIRQALEELPGPYGRG